MTEEADISSPCVGKCELDKAEQNCLGCGRSLEEIARWAEASDAAKLAILDRLAKN